MSEHQRAASGSGPNPPEIIIVAVTTLDRPSSAPTERSMPAVMMTKVMPIGDDAGLGDRAHDVGDVVRREEQDLAVAARREDDAADHHDDEADEALEPDDQRQRDRGAWLRCRPAVRPVVRWLQTSQAPSVGRREHACARRPPPVNSATLRPSRSTTMRSQRPISSGISLEATRMPRPCAASSRSRA